jgi:hypothetical protein
LISFLFDDTNEFTNLFLVEICIPFAEVGGYYCGSEVSDDPWRGSLNGTYVGWREEEFAELFTTVIGVEEREKRPMD